MMRYRILFALPFAIALFASHVIVQEQDGWDKYQPRTLNQIIKQHSKEAVNEQARVHLLFTADVFPSRVRVTYTGEMRKIYVKKKEFIAAWATSRQLRQEIVDLFEDELLFIEDSVEYWLPVQKQVVPYFSQELKKGEKVDLYLIWIGARREGGVTDWVFLVNEFEKQRNDDA